MGYGPSVIDPFDSLRFQYDGKTTPNQMKAGTFACRKVCVFGLRMYARNAARAITFMLETVLVHCRRIAVWRRYGKQLETATRH